MGSIDKVVDDLNSAGENLILIRQNGLVVGLLADYSIFLLRRTGEVAYDGSYLKNLKGVGFQRDADWNAFSPSFVRSDGIHIYENCFGKSQGPQSAVIKIGEDKVIAFLKETRDWYSGIGFGKYNRWKDTMGAINLGVNNRLVVPPA